MYSDTAIFAGLVLLIFLGLSFWRDWTPRRTQSLAVLQALSKMLTGNNDDFLIAGLGQPTRVGRYAIPIHTWKTYGGGDWHNPIEASRVAAAILRDKKLLYHFYFHRDPNPYMIYLLWTSPGGYLRPSAEERQHATAFAQLCS